MQNIFSFRKNNYLFFFIILILFTFISCETDDIVKQRNNRASQGKGDILIGVALPNPDTEMQFISGISMALSEINDAGGVLQRKIKLLYSYDEGSVTLGRRIANKFASNLDVVAVIGHDYSHVSIAAASIYEFSGIVMLNPLSTSPELTSLGYKRIFRIIPNDNVFGNELARFAFKKGFKRIIIFYNKNSYGEGLANSFEKQAEEIGIEIVDRLSYVQTNNNYIKNVMLNWKTHYSFDAIFLACLADDAGIIIKEARKQGIDAVFLGSQGIDSPLLWQIGGDSVEGTYVANIFNPDENRINVKNFVNKFKKKFNVNPDLNAAIAYDSLKLLGYAISCANSAEPDKIRAKLHEISGFDGITGKHKFDLSGENTGGKIIMTVVSGNKFIISNKD